MHIGEEYNYDDNFIRMTTISLCKVLGTKIRWINKWSDGKKIRVVLPFYTSFSGSERLMLDAFVDDIASTRVELNTDQKQRGLITFKGGTQRDDEVANPNQYISKETKINDEYKSIVSRTKGVPISLNYDIQIRLDNEWEVYSCYQRILDVLYNYRFFNISYFGIKIDAFFKLPNDSGIEIPRELNMSSEDIKTIKFSLEINTYYPVFTVLTDDFEVCDNDDQFDWDFLGIKRPDGTGPLSADGVLKRVYWYNNMVDKKSKEVLIAEKEEMRNNEINNLE